MSTRVLVVKVKVVSYGKVLSHRRLLKFWKGGAII
jgi:hypothetical protein